MLSTNSDPSVKAILDANRNSLMLLDLKFSIGTLSLGCAGFIASLYGMNLANYLEEAEWGFGGVSSTCAILGVFVCTYGLSRLRKVQRVSMWGESGVGNVVARNGPRSLGGRGSWAVTEENEAKNMLDAGRRAEARRVLALREAVLQERYTPGTMVSTAGKK